MRKRSGYFIPLSRLAIRGGTGWIVYPARFDIWGLMLWREHQIWEQ